MSTGNEIETKVLFTPFIEVTVEDGRVTEVSIDWSDSCMGVNGEGFDPDNPDEPVATKFIDNSQLQERVLNALTASL